MSGGTSAVAMASTGMQAFGAVTSAVGAYNASKQTQAAYDYQAQVSANNAQYEEWQARDAITRGQSSEQNARLKAAQLEGTQRASMAARGLALDEGSPLDILTTTDYMGERDALTIRDNASRDAWALREGAKGNLSNADMLRARADSENPLMAGASTFLTGATSVASSWYRFHTAGVKGF